MAADVEAQKAKRDKFSRYMPLTIPRFHPHHKFCKLQEAPPQPRQWHRLHQREEHEVQPEVREVLWRIYQGLFPFLCPAWFCQCQDYSTVTTKLKTVTGHQGQSGERHCCLRILSVFVKTPGERLSLFHSLCLKLGRINIWKILIQLPMTSIFSLSSPCWLNWCKTIRRFLMYLKFWIDLSCIDFNKEREAFSRSDYKGCPTQGPGVWVEGGGGAWVLRAGGAGVGQGESGS